MDFDEHKTGRVDTIGKPPIKVMDPMAFEFLFVLNYSGLSFDHDENPRRARQARCLVPAFCGLDLD